MLIPIKTFTGEFPRTNAYLIADNAAQEAVDCDFLAGSLRGVPSDDPVALMAGINIEGAKSLFVYDGGAASGNLFMWTYDVNAVRSPVASDAFSRFYWTSDAGFFVSRGDVHTGGEPSSANTYKVGVPRPVAAPALVDGGASFSFNGFTPTAYAAGCERTDGSIFDLQVITPEMISETTATGGGLSVTFAANLSCPNVGVPGTVTQLAPDSNGDITPDHAAVLHYPTIIDESTLFPTSTNPAMVLLPGKWRLNSSGVLSVESNSNLTGVTQWQPVNAYRVSYMGKVWETQALYNALMSGSVNVDPGSQAEESTAASAGPVVFVTMTNAEGISVTLRAKAEAADSVVPTDLAGLSAAISVEAGTVTTTMWVSKALSTPRSYVYTYVNQYGEEGPPSDALFIDAVSQTASLELIYIPPGDESHGYCPINRLRFYRTSGSGNSSDFFFVGETVINTGYYTYLDDTQDAALGEPLTTWNYYPPDQTIVGLTTMANGILVGFKGSEVHFMEPYLPYACNPSAIKPLPHRIVDICAFEGGLYVTTTAEPYIIQGSAPEYMTDMKVAAVQGGVSKGSMVNYNGQVVYASRDGIVTMSGVQASLDMSFKFFTRQGWIARYGNKLSQIRLAAHDGSLLAWFADGTPGFLIRFEEESPSLTQLTSGYVAAYHHPLADALYVSNGTQVLAYRAGAGRLAYKWHSKEFVVTRPVNFAACQIVGTGGTAVLKVFADGILRITQSVPLEDSGMSIVRLPGGFLARRWSFSLEGSGEVEEATLTTSVAELRNA